MTVDVEGSGSGPSYEILQGFPDDSEQFAEIKPVRYRCVLAHLHKTLDGEVVHQSGEVIAVVPMTQVNYGIGLYSGREMSGTVYLPDMTLDLMPHSPLNDFDRRPHPDQQGVPIGATFELGNRAVYVMRNEEVVWGGILWTRNYSSGSPTLTVTGLSWEGYAYYRALRKSIVFENWANVYTIWYAVLRQMLEDFTWTGPGSGEALDSQTFEGGEETQPVMVKWTGLTRPGEGFNAPTRNFIEAWPNNVPDIELPPADLGWWRGSPLVQVMTTVKETFRGYDMNKVGEALQQWADTETVASATAPNLMSRFEYRVVCWFDEAEQRFRQRYVFGEMHYPSEGSQDPDGIINGLIGTNTFDIVNSLDNKLIFDFPGQISSWSLAETMEEGATRVIATGGGDAGNKHVAYASQSDLLNEPTTGEIGSQGWLLYDRVASYDTMVPSDLQNRGDRVLEMCHVPEAVQISDLGAAPSSGQRTSERSTDLSISLYRDPTMTFPEFGVGDWATFAISDPFYGGTMYLQRRIIGYTVTVVPDQESDYSHEQIELELTDETKIAES